MNDTLPKSLMLIVAFIQGVFLFLLYHSVELGVWPSKNPVWLFIFIALITAVPTFFMLLVSKDNLSKAIFCLLPFSITILITAAYTGVQLTPTEWVRNEFIIFSFTLTMGIASFKALMYSQEYSAQTSLHYSSLFHHSWRNFLVLALSMIFTLLFFGVLLLWGMLFDVIGINFFQKLFLKEWFFFPAGSLAFACAIIIFRNLDKIIASISGLLKALIKSLLPLLASLSIIFLITLCIKGFSSLWQTNLGSGLILWLQALMLFFVNAVYQGDSKESPYPIFIHRLIYAGVSILPVYGIIALFGLMVRINQYGLTVQRCWAVFVAIILFIFTLGYLWSIIKKQDNWLEGLAWVNVKMGMFLMLMLALINSPVGNFQALSAQNQLARIDSGALSLSKLDLNYFKFNLGRQGYLALQEIKAKYGETNSRLASRIDNLYQNDFRVDIPLMMPADIENALSIWPVNRTVPRTVLQGMLGQENMIGRPFTDFSAGNSLALGAIPTINNLRFDDRFYAIFIEMNALDKNTDNSEEIIFIQESTGGYRSFWLWFLQDNEWQAKRLNHPYSRQDIDLSKIFEENQIKIITNPWNDIQIGELRLSVSE